MKEDLYLNGDDKNLPCHSERSEESRKISFNYYSLDYSLRFRMTDKGKDVISKRSEKSNK